MPSKDNDTAIQLPLPIGAQADIRVDYRDSSGEIASLAGTVGVIYNVPAAPDGRYQVRLVNGIEAAFPHRHLTIFSI